MESRFGKVALVLIGVVLMLVFILPAGIQNLAGQAGADLGTIGGEEVSADAVRESRVLLDAAQNVVFEIQPGQYDPLPAVRLGPEVARDLAAQPELFHLLRAEAAQDGVGMPINRVEELLLTNDARVRLSRDEDPVPFAQITGESLRNTYLLATKAVNDVALNAARQTDFFKVSRPLADFTLAVQAQDVTVEAATFAAGEFVGDVPEPADDAVRDQFDRLAAVAPGAATADNPHGFGYRLPDAVKLEYAVVPRDAVEAAVRRELEAQSIAERETELFGYWQQNRARFAPPATQPATRPATLPADAADPLTKDNPRVAAFLDEQAALVEGEAAVEWSAYVAVHDDVVEAILRDRANAAGDRLVRRLTQAMTADYRAYDVAQQQGQDPPLSRVDLPANDPDYLPRLADQVAEENGVAPRVEARRRDLIPVNDLTAETVGPIADSFLIVGQSLLPFGQYVASQAEALLDADALEAARRTPLSLDVLEPSQPLRGRDGDAYVFRIVEARDDRPAADLAAVADDVRRDLKLAAAYGRAVDAAEALAAEAESAGGDLSAVAPERAESVGPFTPGTGGLPAGSTAFGTPPPAGRAYADVIRGLYRLLPDDGGDGGEGGEGGEGRSAGDPGVIEMPAALRAAAARVTAVAPRFETAEQRRQLLARARAQAAAEVRNSPAALAEFYDPAQVVRRVGYDGTLIRDPAAEDEEE